MIGIINADVGDFDRCALWDNGKSCWIAINMKENVMEKIERKFLEIFGCLRFERDGFFGLRIGILECNIGSTWIVRKVYTKIVDIVSLQRDIYFFLCNHRIMRNASDA